MIYVLAYVDVRFHPRPFYFNKPKANINLKKVDIKFSVHVSRIAFSNRGRMIIWIWHTVHSYLYPTDISGHHLSLFNKGELVVIIMW